LLHVNGVETSCLLVLVCEEYEGGMVVGKQNIYDDDAFFDSYLALRDNPTSANEIEERPAFFSMLPDIRGKRILDLGCGAGENCKAFAAQGARTVVGIDISKKMIQQAAAHEVNPDVLFRVCAMEDISQIAGTFDIITSSMAIHYVEDFSKLLMDVHNLLESEGVFLFSQEHPFTTAPIDGSKWIRDDEDHIDHYRLRDYMMGGFRSVQWLDHKVEKYHRTFSDIVNALCTAGFIIEEIMEPIASEATRERLPSYQKTIHKPNFLLVRARKK
jgi:SAM-dependent methyltransferase